MNINDKIKEIEIKDILLFGKTYGTRYFRADEEKIQELTESIKRFGVINPIIVRQSIVARKYELIAGETRTIAASRAGLTKVPALIRDYDDKTAAAIYGESNRYRDKISICEAAFMERYADEAREQAEGKGAVPLSESKRSRLTYLIPSLRKMVDRKRISIDAGCTISYLPKEEQEKIHFFLTGTQTILTKEAASALRNLYENRKKPYGLSLTATDIDEAVKNNMAEKRKMKTINVPRCLIRKLPEDMRKSKSLQELVEKLIKDYIEATQK